MNGSSVPMNYYSPGSFTLLLTMKSARIIRTNEPLLVEEVAVPRPKYDQVLIRVHSAGVCHSDLHLWEGGYVGPGGSFMKVEDRGVRFPLTPGHEVAGTIEDVGESVTGYQRGEKVLVYPWIGEGLCPACRVGEEHLCDSPRTLGIYQDGGYSQFILIPSYKYVIRIDGLDTESSASLACSGLTAYTAVKKTQVQAGDTMVVVGAGGLGLMAVQIAKAITNSRIIIVDINDNKLKEAKQLGADEAINSLSTNPSDTVKEITSGVGSEAVVDFVNNTKTAPASINMLRKRGKLVLVGLFGGSLDLNLALIPLRAYTLTGAYTGKFADLVELVALAKSGKIQSVVSKRFTLDQANQALGDLKSGKIIGRAVLNPEN
ncbi:MAG TPA: alcohol dehydrogenase [Nitrososphaeraceae archaeon]|nr:alcohol dehydrogenase [Nitrososphaeraceae archaeon]